MSVNSINTKLIPDILTSSKFRTFRHVVLLIANSILAFGISVKGEYKTNFGQYYEWGIFFIVFIVTIYVNMYILVPKLLLKNKLGSYFTSLLGCILLLILLISLSQFTFHHVDWDEALNYTNILFSLIGAMIIFGIIITSSSAFVIFKSWIVYNQRISELETATLDS